jgi:hypothetical protein
MENIQELLQKIGYIDEDGKANTTAITELSEHTTKEFVHGLYQHLIEDEYRITFNICELLYYLCSKGQDERAARIIHFLRVFMRLNVSTDIKYVLDNKITQRDYICDFVLHFCEALMKLMADTGFEDENGEAETAL